MGRRSKRLVKRKQEAKLQLSAPQQEIMKKFEKYLDKYDKKKADPNAVVLEGKDIMDLVVLRRLGADIAPTLAKRAYEKLPPTFFLSKTHRTTYERIMKEILKNVEIKGNEKILSVGSGTGHIEIFIAKNMVPKGKVVGMDFSKNMVKFATDVAKQEKAENASFCVGDAGSLPVKDKRFDIVISLDAVNWVERKKLDSTVDHIASKLKREPSSKFILGFPITKLSTTLGELDKSTAQSTGNRIDHEDINRFSKMLKQKGLVVEKRTMFAAIHPYTEKLGGQRVILIIKPKHNLK